MSLSHTALTTLSTLLNQSLKPQGVTVQVSHRDRQLYFLLEGQTLPLQDRYVPYLRQGFQTLRQSSAWQAEESLADFRQLQGVTIYARVQGEKQVGWTASFPLEAGLEAPPSPHPGPVTGQDPVAVPANGSATPSPKSPSPDRPPSPAAPPASSPELDPDLETETIALTPEAILAPDLFRATAPTPIAELPPRSTSPQPIAAPEFSPSPASTPTPIATPTPSRSIPSADDWDLVEDNTAVQELLRLDLPALIVEVESSTVSSVEVGSRTGPEAPVPGTATLPPPQPWVTQAAEERPQSDGQAKGRKKPPIAQGPEPPIALEPEPTSPSETPLSQGSQDPNLDPNLDPTLNPNLDPNPDPSPQELGHDRAQSTQATADRPTPTPLDDLQDFPVPIPHPLPDYDPSAQPSPGAPAPLPNSPPASQGLPWDPTDGDPEEVTEPATLLSRQGLMAKVLMGLLLLLGVGAGGFYGLFLPHQSRTLAEVQTQAEALDPAPQNLDQLQNLVTTLEALQGRLETVPPIAVSVYAQAQDQQEQLQQILTVAQAQLTEQQTADENLKTAKRLAAEAIRIEETTPIVNPEVLATAQEKWIAANYFLSLVPPESWSALEADRLRSAYAQQLTRMVQLQARSQPRSPASPAPGTDPLEASPNPDAALGTETPDAALGSEIPDAALETETPADDGSEFGEDGETPELVLPE